MRNTAMRFSLVLAVARATSRNRLLQIASNTMNTVIKLFEKAARADRVAVIVVRIGLVVVLVWIGGLKAFAYEAEGIVPFVANSPLMSFFYRQPPGEYRQHMNPAGELVPANREWHERNGTYTFAYGLGTVIVAFGVMIALHPWLPQVAAVGSFLAFLMSFVTLSFLITTPECWVPALGAPEHGFPLLDLPGLVVVKDSIMMGAALVTMADSAKAYVRRKAAAPEAFSQRELATVGS
jgi:reactive chlorine resistance protein C